MRMVSVSGRSIARVVVGLCLILVAVAYVRVYWQPEASETMASKRLVPVYSVERKDKKIAISFDAAWGAEKTSEIMDILQDKGIRSTFFLVGFWVDRYPEKVKEISLRGHEIGNHSTNHPHMTELSAQQIRDELENTSEKIVKLGGAKPVLFRPPYGDYNNTVIQTATEAGYTAIQWDVDSLDWKEKGIDPMIQQVVTNVKPGSIVLFHNNSKYILEALPTILDQLQSEGYEIVPVSELLLPGETTIDGAGRQRERVKSAM